MLNILTDDWINVKVMKKNYPTDFDIPTRKELNSLSIGKLVKIGNKLERFWVKITEISDNFILGKIDNYLTFNSKYDYGNIILFDKKNVYEIHNDALNDIINDHIINECLFKKKKKK
jgi:hypothetical protein